MMHHRPGAGQGLTLVAVLLLAVPAFAEDLGRFQFQRKISVPAGGTSRVDLDAAVLEGAREDLNDLRLVSSAGETISFRLVIPQDRVFSEERQGTIVEARRDEDTRAQIVLCDLGAAPGTHNRLLLETSSTNFRSWVSLESSADQETWAVLRLDGAIYDLPAGARSIAVDYPAITDRYLRLTIHDHQGTAIVLTGVRAQQRVFEPAPHSQTPASVVERFDDTLQGESRLTLDLGHARAASDGLVLDFGKRINFACPVTVEGSETLSGWQPVATGALFAYEEPNLSIRGDRLDYVETHARYLRLIIGHGGQAPLQFGRIAVASRVRALIFQAYEGAHYLLYYGNPSVDRPTFRRETELPAAATAGTLGPVVANPAWRDPVTHKRLGFYVGGAAIVVVIALVLLARRRTLRLDEEDRLGGDGQS